MFRELRNKILRLLSRARLTGADGDRPLRVIQVKGLASDVRDDVEHVEPYGFTAEPIVGAEALIASIGGDRDHTVGIVVADRRFRPRGLKPGEACLYDDLGRRVFLLRDRVLIEGANSPIDITTSAEIRMHGSKLIVDAPIETTSTIVAKGDITDCSASGGRSMASMRSTYNGHTHPHGSSTSSAPNQKM